MNNIPNNIPQPNTDVEPQTAGEQSAQNADISEIRTFEIHNGSRYSPSPSEIYNATAPSNTPQYHYGTAQTFFNPQYIEAQRQKMLARKQEEKKLKSLGTNTGITLLIMLAVSYAISFTLILPGVYSLYETNLTFSCAFAIFYSVITVGGAFLVGAKLFKRSGTLRPIPFEAPKDKTKAVLLVLIGLGGCLIANYVTVIFRLFSEGIGIYSDYSAIQDPTSTTDAIMVFLSSAVIPPLVEEFALRGVLMQNLRKHGDAFAVITSAFVFGVFHGNAVQMPFAFLCGLVIGYAVIATESIWTGVAIHALMNAMSAVSSALLYYFDEYTSNTFFYIGSAAGVICGVLALIIYIYRYKNHKLDQTSDFSDGFTNGEKFIKFNTSPIMLVAIILFVIQAISQLTTTPVSY